MAEQMNTTDKGRSRSLPPRIDLTPMVDLGFLLITFFIFTATLSNPTAITTLLPADSTDSTFVAASGSVTLIAGAGGLAYYQGIDAGRAEIISWADTDALRVRLIGLQMQLKGIDGNDDKLFVMIKPTEQASFARVVQMLDEMKICQMKRYTLADLSPEEKALFGRL